MEASREMIAMATRSSNRVKPSSLVLLDTNFAVFLVIMINNHDGLLPAATFNDHLDGQSLFG